MSPGGAFLKTDNEVPPKAVVVVVPSERYLKDFPVMLVARVSRRVRGERPGIALRWQRCITRSGVRRIWQFMSAYPNLWEDIPPLPTKEVASSPIAGYDFSSNTFYVPKEARTGSTTVADEDTRNPVSASPGAPAPGLRANLEEVEANLVASFTYEGSNSDCTVRSIGLDSLFVVSPDRIDRPGTKLTIELPVPIGRTHHKISLACTLISCGKHATLNVEGMHFLINAAYQGSRPGAFERYIKYLYYNMVTRKR